MDALWFVIRVMSGTDFSVRDDLCAMGIDVFVPSYDRVFTHKRNKRKETRTYPVLSGYVMAKVPDEKWPDLRNIKGYLGPLRYEQGRGLPCPISSDIIDMMKSAQDNGLYNRENLRVDLPFGVGDAVSVDVFGVAVKAIINDIEGDTVFVSGLLGGKRMDVRTDVSAIGAVV